MNKIFPPGTALNDVYAGLHAAMPRPLDSELSQHGRHHATRLQAE